MISTRCDYDDHRGCKVTFSNFEYGSFHCTCPCHNKTRQECVKVTVTFEDAAGNKVHIETDQFEYAEYGVDDLTEPPRLDWSTLRVASYQKKFELTTLVHNVRHYTMRLEAARPAIDEGDILDEPE